MGWVRLAFRFLRSLVRCQAELAAENLALRQQFAILRERVKLPRLRPRDRVFWVWLSKLWSNWRFTLLIVQPATGVCWHRQGFRLYWRWKSRAKKPGRPQVWREIRNLVRRMCRENPTWGAPRIHSELRRAVSRDILHFHARVLAIISSNYPEFKPELVGFTSCQTCRELLSELRPS